MMFRSSRSPAPAAAQLSPLPYAAPSTPRSYLTPLEALTDGIVKHRRILYGFVVAFMLLAFNGMWRVGRDSALYRGLGHSLAIGKGYAAGKFASKQIYPGLPVVLAGLEKFFGQRDLPPILLINLMAVACLLVTYRLIALRFPRWMAIVVTVGVGLNGWILELANEIRDDVPFLLGLLLALYGWERLRMHARREDEALPDHPTRGSGSTWASIAYLATGLALAAVMRPTFWILAGSWVLVCVGGLFTGPRKFYAAGLGVLVVVAVVLALVDPRVKGFRPLGGGYEQDAKHALKRAGENIKESIPELLGGEMSYGVFGEKWGRGLTELMTLAMIVSAFWLIRHDPMWALLVFLTIFVTLVMRPVPRYFVMIVPLMLLGWVLMWVSIAQHVPAKWAGVALLLGLALYGVTNVDRCVKVVAQQRGWRNLGREEDRPKWKYVMEISEAIKRDVPENAKIITPGASIVGYLTGREALMWRDIDPKTAPQHYPAKIRAMNIGYAVFPPNLYDRGERMIRELMDRGVIVPEQRVSKVGDMMITTIQVNVPAGDWRETPLVSLTPRLRELGRPTTQELAHREAKQRATEKKTRVALKEYQAEKARRFRKLQLKKDPALMEAKRRKLRRAAAAATAPAPAAAATTRPVAPAKTFP